MSSGRPIIVIKKKQAHSGHHGGAWKVAYADFVTAMMALFIVLWLMNTSKQIQEAVGGYFKDPTGIGKKVGTTMDGKGGDTTAKKDDMEKLKEEFEKSIKKIADFDKLKNQIEITVTPEGLRIEMLETEAGTFFDSGSPEPNESGRGLLMMLAQEIAKLPNRISIEGHTDSRPYTGGSNYTNWELSVDRANAARRIMQQNGMRADQVSQVRGFADQRLRDTANPADPRNRRISMIVGYLDPPKAGAPEAPAKTEPEPAPAQSQPDAAPAEAHP